MKKTVLIVTVILCFLLAGCGGQDIAPGSGSRAEASSGAPSSKVETSASDTASAKPEESSSSSSTSSTPASAPTEDSTAEPEQPQEPASEPDVSSEPEIGTQTATLYIGTKSGGFTEYPLAYEGDLTPETLIQGIAGLTGWDLTLAEPVISGKGGMSVCLSENSALFMGPPEPQKEEFHMFSGEQLAETILDSIQKTLQEGFTLEGGDPDALDIWYYMAGEQPLALPSLGLSWPMDQPYQWAEAETE